ncbi:MAG TPA: cytochrome c, partial [Acidobacteriaceae bacterium]
MRHSSASSARIIGLLTAVCVAHAALGQASAAFTAAQADQGRAVYTQNCAMCHGANLEGTAEAPSLSNVSFQSQWKPRVVGELFGEIVETMPPTRPGTLTNQEGLAVTAFILQRNGGIAGKQPLSGGSAARITQILSGLPPLDNEPAVMGVPDRPGGRYGRNGPREILTIGDNRPGGSTMDATAEARYKELRAPLDKVTP